MYRFRRESKDIFFHGTNSGYTYTKTNKKSTTKKRQTVTSNRLYGYTRMPLGLKNPSTTFQGSIKVALATAK